MAKAKANAPLAASLLALSPFRTHREDKQDYHLIAESLKIFNRVLHFNPSLEHTFTSTTMAGKKIAAPEYVYVILGTATYDMNSTIHGVYASQGAALEAAGGNLSLVNSVAVNYNGAYVFETRSQSLHQLTHHQ